MNYEFISAVNGEDGELEAWLECHSEKEIRDAIKYEFNEIKSEYENKMKEFRKIL